jgi:hypothetical protein
LRQVSRDHLQGRKLNVFFWIEWGGVDTLIVAAGVSALQPLMAVAGVEDCQKGREWAQATRDGIQHAVDVANLATRGNYIGPLVAAVTFVRTSTEPLPKPN